MVLCAHVRAHECTHGELRELSSGPLVLLVVEYCRSTVVLLYIGSYGLYTGCTAGVLTHVCIWLCIGAHT